MGSLTNKKMLVTGGGGFLGSHVVERLKATGCKDIVVPRSSRYDLRDPETCFTLMKREKPDIVIHLAAVYGGLERNRRCPGEILYANVSMGIHLMEAARLCGTEKFVSCGSYSAYPKDAAVPYMEETIWSGFPEETTGWYGLSKRLLLAQGQAYRKQYGFSAVHLIPANLYGPRDRFDPATAGVAAALISRCVMAQLEGRKQLTVWGSGKATREFLYAEDAAEAIVLAAERYDGDTPVNIGTGIETPIRSLAELIAEKTGFEGELVWDASKPEGHPRKVMDVRKAMERFGFAAKTSLSDGIGKTVEWFRLHNGGKS